MSSSIVWRWDTAIKMHFKKEKYKYLIIQKKTQGLKPMNTSKRDIDIFIPIVIFELIG